jgi:hypothetical protein
MNGKIMKGICWIIPKMVSTLKYIMLDPSILGVALFILVYLHVYTSFSLCHWLDYQVFPWLEDDCYNPKLHHTCLPGIRPIHIPSLPKLC